MNYPETHDQRELIKNQHTIPEDRQTIYLNSGVGEHYFKKKQMLEKGKVT
jgi:hypothetical protein